MSELVDETSLKTLKTMNIHGKYFDSKKCSNLSYNFIIHNGFPGTEYGVNFQTALGYVS